jgi:predicted metal-dependent phosphoesterase TrpH
LERLVGGKRCSEAGRVLKVELHAHTDEDPDDRIPHSTAQLIDHAAGLGYGALAVTLHDHYFDPAPYAGYARERGIVLLSGIERTVARKHMLLINFPPECADVVSFADLRQLRTRSAGLVVAPHPFYPAFTALGHLLNQHAALIDAVEINAMYTPRIDFNQPAIAWARAHGKPLVGNSDLHRLEQMGTTYSMVDAPPVADAICEAIRNGKVQVRTQPLAFTRAARIFSAMLVGGLYKRGARTSAVRRGAVRS